MQRMNELKDNSRITKCRGANCGIEIESGRTRYWDNHNSVNGVVCPNCYAKTPKEMQDSEKAAPREGASNTEIKQVNDKLATVIATMDGLLLRLMSNEEKLDKVLTALSQEANI